MEGNEYVSLLSWVKNIYPGHELMQHPDLKVDLSDMQPLIKPESLKELENEYLRVIIYIHKYIYILKWKQNILWSLQMLFNLRLWQRTTRIG